MNQEAVDDLEAALARLRERGWTRGVMIDIPTGKRCIVGAFGWPFPTDSPGIPFLAQAARAWKTAPKFWNDISDLAVAMRFNDATGRTFAEVEELFLRAIEAARGHTVQAV